MCVCGRMVGEVWGNKGKTEGAPVQHKLLSLTMRREQLSLCYTTAMDSVNGYPRNRRVSVSSARALLRGAALQGCG